MPMDEGWWEELVVQVETHGVDNVVFSYDEVNSFYATDLSVTDVKFEDGKIVVKLER